MPVNFKLKKGFDIRLKGSATKVIAGDVNSTLFGLRPGDFPGLTPKLTVKPGDQVKAGSPLFASKVRPEITFTSPVSGVVKSINRGDQRRILEVVVEKQGEDYIDFGKDDPGKLKRQEIIARMLVSGLWPSVRQRPYHVIANPNDTPKSVFVSGFDTAPLAPDLNFVAENTPPGYLRSGFQVLNALSGGKVHLVLDGKSTQSATLAGITGVEISYFSGPHPAGNTGVHIHHLDPVSKGEVVWYVNLQDVATIGRLFCDGVYRPERIIAFTGSEVSEPSYFRVTSGASIANLVSGRLKSENCRIISGNVLTGTAISADGFLGYYDSQVTVIPEGNYHEFFGWMMPGASKHSFSKTFLSALAGKKEFRLDTNMHGGHRAFVMTGQYEKVVPMDILPMQLLKAIIAEDIDNMENLGIYEVAEEDLALCEYICSSKIEIQSVVRKGLDLMMKEMN
ncbi:MAG: Na(+)-translocating NADH-quinone reductase subunit A [Bacteroidales bacterium]